MFTHIHPLGTAARDARRADLVVAAEILDPLDMFRGGCAGVDIGSTDVGSHIGCIELVTGDTGDTGFRTQTIDSRSLNDKTDLTEEGHLEAASLIPSTSDAPQT